MKSIENISKFILEMGVLKRTARTGWWPAGIKHPESIADHSFRTIITGYFLAKMENVDTDKVVRMLLFHEMAEARIGDINKLGRNYIPESTEHEVVEDQLKELPDEVKSELKQLHTEFVRRKTKEAIVAKDADWLENAIQAKEYLDQGNHDAQNWIDNVRKSLKTESAKKILAEIESNKTNYWYFDKKKLD